MRILLTDIDAEGRSCVVSESEVVPAQVEGIPGFAMASLYGTSESPPPARPPALADTVDVRLAPGLIRWMVIDHQPKSSQDEPNSTERMHHTDALDLIFVQEGSADLILEDGAHAMGPGDCVVTPGVDHAWAAGPIGCRLIAVSIGTPPPA